METQQTSSAIEKIINTVIEFFVNYSFQVVGAVVILLVGFVIAGWIAAGLLKLFQKRNLDITLSKFLASVVRFSVIGFAIIVALGKFGITIAPFVAALGALAFGASFAIQGPLANYGAGLSIILARPFVVGNTISVADVSGVVEEVKLACTILTNEDGVRITIPNKHIVGEIIHNSFENRIVEGVVGISYTDNPEDGVRVVKETLSQFSDVAKTPAPQVGIQSFGESSVDIAYRYWLPTKKYFQMSYQINLAVFKAIQKTKLTIPFPQRDIHIVSQPSGKSAVGATN